MSHPTPPDTAVAMDLLGARLCTPSCLLAMDSFIEDCQCRCMGKYHAALLWAPVTTWAGPSEMTDEGRETFISERSGS